MKAFLQYKYRKGIIILLGALVLFTSCRPTKHVPDGKYLLKKVTVHCDDKDIDMEELEAYMKQKPNRKLLGVLPFHLRVYNLVNPEKEAKRKEKRKEKLDKINQERRLKRKEPKDKFYFTEWLQNIGEEPVIYEDYLTDKTSRQFKLYLRNKGYYYSQVSDTVKFKRKRVKVSYNIVTNKPYRIRSVDYRVEDHEIKKILLADSANSEIKPGGLFDVDLLQLERNRIVRILKENSYYVFNSEYLDYQVDTGFSNYTVEVVLRLKNPSRKTIPAGVHQKFNIGNVYIYTDYDPKKALQQKAEYFNTFDTLLHEGYYFIFNNKLTIKPEVILRSISLEPGAAYDVRKVDLSYKYLSTLQINKLTNILFRDVTIDSAATERIIDCHIQLTPFTRQSTTIEVEGTNTSGNLGVAASYKYMHKNLFRGAEAFEAKFSGALQKQTALVNTGTDASVVSEYLPFNTLELGPEMSIKFQRLLLPLRLEDFTKKYHPKTSISTAYNFQSRPDYTRTIATAKFGYLWRGMGNFAHYVNPIDLNYIRLTKISPEFWDRIKNSYLRYSYRNQLIAAVNYNFVYTNQDINKTSQDFAYLKAGIETAGNMFSSYSKMTSAETDGNGYSILGVKYAQYAKLDVDFSYHKIINPENIIVYRGFAGIGYPYGNSTAMPFVKQYFAGGANSIRAWPVRSVGPGTYNDTLSFPNQAADIKLETNLEYRFDVIAMIEAAMFVDVGNIWSIDSSDERQGSQFDFSSFYKELAIGAGAGIRIDLDFFIIRLDFGYKIMDPTEPEGRRLVIGTRPFDRKEYSLNLAIGYPF